MGRAQGRAHPSQTAGFDGAFGRRRGNGAGALAASEPTAEALRIHRQLQDQLAAGQLEDTLRLLSAERERLIGAPLLRDLSARLHFEIFNARRFATSQAVAQAQMLLADIGWRDHARAETVLRDEFGGLHLWPNGTAHGPDVLQTRGSDQRGRNPFSGTPYGTTVCGRAVNAEEFIRAARGAWLRTGSEPVEESDERLLCPQCAVQHSQFAECAESWPPALLSTGGDAQLRDALLTDPATPEQVASVIGDDPSLFALQAELAGNFRRVLCETLGGELAQASGLRIFQLLGGEGPGVLRKLSQAKVKPAGLLGPGDFSALLSEHWPLPGPEDRRAIFAKDLTRALYAAASRQVRERKRAAA